MSDSIVIRSFAGGELAPTLAARADLAKYTIGLRRCRNFIVQRHGGVANRPGFRFVEACKTISSNVRLLRYVSEVDGESCLIEAGAGYLRFYQNGARVEIDGGTVAAWNGATDYVIGDLAESGGVFYYAKTDHSGSAPPSANWHALTGEIYEVPTPFADPGLFRWVQSGRVITLTHPNHVPHDLVFESLTRWPIVPLVTAPKVAPPIGLALVSGAGARSFGYIVTAAHPLSYEESEPSAQIVAAGAAAPTPDAPHTLTWTPVQTPPLPAIGLTSPEYYVYCDPYGNGTYGFIGTATGAAQFKNPGLQPDFAVTPPLPRLLFDDTDEFPAVAAYHKQRRFFARSNAIPDAIWASRVGFPDNFGISSPLQDDDALEFRIAGNNHHHVRHLISLKELIVMTGGGCWPLRGLGGILAPNTLDFDQESYAGCSDVPPIVIGNRILYVQARGTILRDLGFEQEVEGLNGKDLTIYASHLFDGFTLPSIDFAEVPHSIAWCCRNDGTLLGLTYVAAEDIWGWHRHDTAAGGRFEQVCTVPEAGEDAVYVVVRRTIGGAFVRYIERLERRQILTWDTDIFFVDSGLSYSGAPVSSVGGLDHLEGEVVAIVGDGVVVFNGDPTAANASAFRVTGGVVSLGAAYSIVHVGLAIRHGEIELLNLDVAGSDMRDKRKRVGSITVIVDASSRSFMAGPDETHLTRQRPAPYDTAVAPHSGDVEHNIISRFNEHGRVLIRQTDPLPLTVLGVVPNVEIGG